MPLHTRLSRSRCARCAVFALALGALLAFYSPARAEYHDRVRVWRPPWRMSTVRLSAAYEQMLRDQLAEGHELPDAVIRRWSLDVPEQDATLAPALAAPSEYPRDGVERTETQALAPDAQINDKSGDGLVCPTCGGLPLGQAETTIASLGNFLLAGWNDAHGFCAGGAVQGFGYSLNGGASWVDFGDPPAYPGNTGRYRGDPVHGVNRKTGDFYLLGLYEGGVPGSGIAMLRGHFGGGTFIIDDNRQIALGGANFLDKPWFAVDSLSGNIYVTYSNFVGGVNSQIEFLRSTDHDSTFSAPLVLSSPAAFGAVQGSRPVVGPNGEVMVVWYEGDFPLSHIRVRKSTDGGLSFGPEFTVADFYENFWSGSPGFRRGFAVTLPTLACDVSSGPHRGRVYVGWDEGINWTDETFSTASAKSEVENNGSFANATPFTVGQILRGGFSSSADVDLYKFSGLQGQTIVFESDSASAATINLRLICAADTSSIGNYRFLAFDQATAPGVVFTLPADGSYYMRLSDATSTIGNYRILTTFDTPSPGERARDHRDRFVAYSDDASSWGTPARVNDNAPWFDGCFPELTVDGTGAVHAFWHDFRDDPGCGAMSYEYMVSSGDGGVTWGANRRVSDVQSFWSVNACGSANQGDYQGVTSEGTRYYPIWSDSRLGDPDVWSEADNFDMSLVPPASSSELNGATVVKNFTLTNSGNVDQTFSWQLTESNGWLTGVTPGASGSVTLAAGASQVVSATLVVSPSCSPTFRDSLKMVANDLRIPGKNRSAAIQVTCQPPADVEASAAALWLAAPQPNPSSGATLFHFALPREGAVTLDLFGAGGARVRRLAGSTLAAGEHSMVWDGRDDSGRRVPPGIYFARFAASGRVLERTVSRVR